MWGFVWNTRCSRNISGQQSSTSLAPGTSLTEDSFSMQPRWEWGGWFQGDLHEEHTNVALLHAQFTVGLVLPWESIITAARTRGRAWDVMRVMGAGCKYRCCAHLSCCAAWFLTGHRAVLGPRFKQLKVRRCHTQSRCRVLRKGKLMGSGNTGPLFPRQTSSTATAWCWRLLFCIPGSLCTPLPHPRQLPSATLPPFVERPCGQIPAVASSVKQRGGPVELVTKDEAYFQSCKFSLSLFFFNKTNIFYIEHMSKW